MKITEAGRMRAIYIYAARTGDCEPNAMVLALENALDAMIAETFGSSDDADTPLAAAAREAGWALSELVDEIDWNKRGQVSDIITRLGLALSDANPRAAAEPVDPTELVAAAKEAYEQIRDWSGSAFLAGEADPEMTDDECKARLYSDLCKLGNHMLWIAEKLTAYVSAPPAALAAAPASVIPEGRYSVPDWLVERVENCVLTSNIAAYAGLADWAAFEAGQDNAVENIVKMLRSLASAPKGGADG